MRYIIHSSVCFWSSACRRINDVWNIAVRFKVTPNPPSLQSARTLTIHSVLPSSLVAPDVLTLRLLLHLLANYPGPLAPRFLNFTFIVTFFSTYSVKKIFNFMCKCAQFLYFLLCDSFLLCVYAKGNYFVSSYCDEFRWVY